MKKAVIEIMKKLSQTAAGKKMTPKQLEDRAKLDYKDATQFKAKEARESDKFINRSNKMLESMRNPKDPKSKAFLKAQEKEIAKYENMKKGGKVGMGMTKNNYKKGGKVSSCSKRADGCAVKGKTKGRMV